MGGVLVKNHLKIIRSLGMSLLLVLLLSAVAISEDSCEVTVVITESSSSGDGTESKTVITTYDSESGVTKTTEVSGEDPTTPEGSDTEDNGSNGDTVPTETPDSQPDDVVIEIFSDEWFELVLATLDNEEQLSAIDLMQDATDTANVEY